MRKWYMPGITDTFLKHNFSSTHQSRVCSSRVHARILIQSPSSGCSTHSQTKDIRRNDKLEVSGRNVGFLFFFFFLFFHTFSLLLQTDQQQRHCRSKNPDRCAIESCSRPRSTPNREKQGAQEWKLQHCHQHHQSPSRCCSSFAVRREPNRVSERNWTC